MGYNSFDDFIAKTTVNGQFLRQEFQKLYAGGTAVAGNWYDLQQGAGTPAEYLHGNYIKNYSFVAGTDPWIFSGAYWAYAPGTHSMTRTANADAIPLTQYTKCVPGQSYYVTVSATVSAGAFTISLGGTNGGTTMTGTGVIRQIIVCGATANAPLSITPNSTAACTLMDLVSVQPIVGTFVPYNDLTEGALWHGGDVASATKHVVNMGAWANFATGLPAVLKIIDVLGVYPRIATDTASRQILSATDIAGGGALIHDGQTTFNEETITNVTNSVVVKATEGVTGGSSNASCNKFAITNTFTIGKIGDEVVSATLWPSLAAYPRAKYVYMWVRSSLALNAGDLSFCTDESAALASSQDVLLPALAQNTWTRVRLDVSGVATTDRDTVISIGLKAVVDKDATYNLYIDDIRFTLPDGVIANGNFYGNATYWTTGTGWAYRSYDVEATAGSASALTQTNIPIVTKVPYQVQYTITNRSAGSVQVALGGVNGTSRSADGTYTETITPTTDNATVSFTKDSSFNGRISHVIIFPKFPRCDEGTANFGAGVRMYYVLDNALTNGTGASNTVIRYTNSSAAVGTPDRMLGATVTNLVSDVAAHLPHSGVAAGKFGPFLPLSGDAGVQSVESFQLSGAGSQAGGAFNLVICKELVSIPITTAYATAERNLMTQLPSLPKVRDGACLMMVVFVGGVIAAGSQFQGYLDFGWGAT